jgi:RNA polymerase sigma-70 factor (ECF subfamily)
MLMIESPPEDLARLLEGRQEAWRDFVRAHGPVIYAAVRRRLTSAGRAGDCDDVVQEVFVRLCKHDFALLRRYDSAKARLSTYLTVIATSTAIDHLRRSKPPTRTLDDAPEAALAVEAVEPEHIEIPDGLLSPRQALVMELLYGKDLDPAEAAEIMGVDAQTVRSMHHKALTKLRAHFAKELE